MRNIQSLEFNDYMQKPTLVHVAKLTRDVWQELSEMPNYVTYVSKRQICATQENNNKYFLVDTIDGLIHGSIGDLLIVNSKGDIDICKPNNFNKFYETTELEQLCSA